MNFDWGKLPKKKNMSKLKQKIESFNKNINPIDFEFSSLLAQFKNFKNEVVKIEIIDGSTSKQKQNNI